MLQFSKYWGRPQLTRMKTHLGTAVGTLMACWLLLLLLLLLQPSTPSSHMLAQPCTLPMPSIGFHAFTPCPSATNPQVYMAPELIENRQSRRSYDPVEVDVWAAGVWLVAL